MTRRRDREARRRVPRGQRSRDRGLSPVVGKTLELGIGVLFVALLTATLFGGVAPEYRAAVGDELGDRTLVAAGERVEAAVPAGGFAGLDRSVAVRLPQAIRGDPYRIVADRDAGDPTLRLVHPDASIGGRVRLSLPERTELRGSWRSSSPSRVLVSGGEGVLSATLVDDGTAGTDSGTAGTDDGTTAEEGP
ncbi:DUF7266 family protein [Halobellus sp. GM3]|uniref:DUF7266 family protein n=1 Tax=Halobellus sp. GM3 TaxID=3458410 RepID=UPI00403DDE70